MKSERGCRDGNSSSRKRTAAPVGEREEGSTGDRGECRAAGWHQQQPRRAVCIQSWKKTPENMNAHHGHLIYSNRKKNGYGSNLCSSMGFESGCVSGAYPVCRKEGRILIASFSHESDR